MTRTVGGGNLSSGFCYSSYMDNCIYVYMYVCAYACMYVCMYVLMSADNAIT